MKTITKYRLTLFIGILIAITITFVLNISWNNYNYGCYFPINIGNQTGITILKCI